MRSVKSKLTIMTSKLSIVKMANMYRVLILPNLLIYLKEYTPCEGQLESEQYQPAYFVFPKSYGRTKS